MPKITYVDAKGNSKTIEVEKWLDRNGRSYTK